MFWVYFTSPDVKMVVPPLVPKTIQQNSKYTQPQNNKQFERTDNIYNKANLHTYDQLVNNSCISFGFLSLESLQWRPEAKLSKQSEVLDVNSAFKYSHFTTPQGSCKASAKAVLISPL